MGTVVAVIDDPSIIRAGMVEVLREAGLRANAFDTAGDLPSDRGADLVVLALRSSQQWAVLDQIPDAVPVVAVLPVATEDACSAALARGARGAVAEGCQPGRLVAAVLAARAGLTAVRSDIARQLATRPSMDADLPEIPEPEFTWLRQRAAGLKFESIADRSPFSGRSIYRKLAELRSRLGAESNHELVAMAARQGQHSGRAA